MSTQKPDFVIDLSVVHNNHVAGLKIQNALKGNGEIINEEAIEADFIREFADIIVQKTAQGFRIILDEGTVEKLKSGHKFDIGDGRELALDENGELAIVNTGMV
jgi:hypothetical protein